MKRSRDDDDENDNKRISLKFIDDKTPCLNIMDMSPIDRRQSLEFNPISSFGYPSEYSRIYSLEKDRRIFNGFENLKNVTNEKIFQKGQEQTFSSKTQIQCVTNVNCIKSRINNTNLTIEDVNISDSGKEVMKNYGITYYNNFNDYDDYDEYNSDDYNNDFDKYEEHIETKYSSYKKTVPNKYNVIISLIREVFIDYKDYICIAGGFSLSNYINHNYDYYVDFSDIDLFIHSCDQETANRIVEKLTDLCGHDLYENENVISGDRGGGMFDSENDYGDNTYGPTVKQLKIQIIKRLYSCPQEIIVGFDIDCCCILTTLDNQTFVTERGYNAIKNGYNVVNFEKLSPSYEYRLSKYNNRGFGIWIPFMEHFKKNVFFDVNVIDRNKGSSIIIKELMKIRKPRNFYNYTGIKPEYLTEDYGNPEELIKFPVVFKSLNPGEQRINTFHRIFLEDPKEWYPEFPQNGINHFKHDIYFDSVVEIDGTEQFQFTLAQNIQRNIKLKPISNFVKDESLELIHHIKNIIPNCTILGDLPYRVITGDSNHKPSVNIWSSNNFSSKIINYLEFHITKMKILIYVKNYINEKLNMNISNINDIGHIVCTKNIKNSLGITDEESIKHFSDIYHYRSNDGFTVLHYYGRDESKDDYHSDIKIVFIATEDTYNALKQIRSINYNKNLERLKMSNKIWSNSYVKNYINLKVTEINKDKFKYMYNYGRPYIMNVNKHDRIEYLSDENNYNDVIENCMVDDFNHLKNFNVTLEINIGDGSTLIQEYIDKSDDNIDGIMYFCDIFVGNKNNYHKAIKGLNYDMDKLKILDYPIYENFIVEN